MLCSLQKKLLLYGFTALCRRKDSGAAMLTEMVWSQHYITLHSKSFSSYSFNCKKTQLLDQSSIKPHGRVGLNLGDLVFCEEWTVVNSETDCLEYPSAIRFLKFLI